MASEIMFNVWNCPQCAKNRVRLIKHSNPMKLFAAITPLESVTMYLLGPLPPFKCGQRFNKLSQVVAMKKTTAAIVAAEFCIHWLYKYGAPKETLNDNVSQFASKFLQETCQVLGISNAFTSAYLPQTNGQAERYNRTLTAMMRCFVYDNPGD